MARKVIIDCDPGIDDAVALCMALFDPRLEVVAVTATEGNVPADRASRNLQALVEMLDPPRLPRVGVASPAEDAPAIDNRRLHGADGLGNAQLAVSALHHPHPSEKILCDEIRAASDLVTIIALGPLTNIARAFKRDPELPRMVGRIIMSGGSVIGVGDVTAAAEFNMHYDPSSAREVFRSPTTKTLVPLDVTRQVSFSLDLVHHLPPETCWAGQLLRRIIPFAFRTHRQELGLEVIRLADAVTLVAATNPELFQTREMAGDVEIRGDLTTGATVFDRRDKADWRPNMEVAVEVDVAAVTDCIVRGLAAAGRGT